MSRSGTPASSAFSKSFKPSTSNSNKVTENSFTPRTRRLAIASKAHVRTAILYHPNGPFSAVHGRVGKMEFAWTTIKDTAQNSEDMDIKEALKRASKDNKTKKDLVTFVSYFFIT
jgi:hypothetical protein